MWVTQKVHSPACRPQPRNGELEVGMAVLVGEGERILVRLLSSPCGD